MSRFRSAVLKVALCLLLPAAATAMAGHVAAAMMPPLHASVQLNWKHQFEFAAFYAAQAKGYYRDAGLDVAIREGGPGIDATHEVASGHADFGVGTSTLILDRSRGQPVVALAALMQHSPIALIALRRNGIESIHDLAGRPVAVDPHNRDEIEAYMLASGIPANRIDLVDQTDWTMRSLDQGKVAAKTIYRSNEPFWIRGHEHEYLLLTPQSAGIDLFGNILFTSQSMLDMHPGMVKAFREATLKGLVYALDHPEEISRLILAKYNTQGKSYEHLMFEASQIRELTRPDIVEPGYMSPGRWRHVVGVYADEGLLPKDYSLDGFLYDTTPARTPAWVAWSTLALLGLLGTAVTVAFKLRTLNGKLRQEVAERTQAETALLESEARYRELVDNANAIILRMAPDGTVTYFNEYAEHFFGYRAEEIIGRHVVGTIVPDHESGTERDLGYMIETILVHPERFQHNENENMTRDGRRVWVRWANRVIVDDQGRPIGVSCIGQDITESKQAEETIRHLAYYDALTRLPNRRLLIDRLRQAIALSFRTQRCGALLFIDLDNFKLLNDSYGHEIGDRFLVETAHRLQACLRGGDSVARLGGDEFVVLLEGLSESTEEAAAQAETLAEKIIDQLGRPYHLSEIEHHSSASIGITLFHDNSLRVDEILKRADLAMYQAKASGRNTFRFFDPTMQAMVESRTRLESELRRAILHREFLFHYQIQVNAAGQAIGVEALARWQHPEHGLILPQEFIPLAEETGLIVPIGEQLLRIACEQIRAWSDDPKASVMTVSVNISARQFHHPDFVAMVLANLSAAGVASGRLVLEITESLLLDNLAEAIEKMTQLKARGVRFSIDDFGTGYSSLAYLKRLPLDELKIDRSFVSDIEGDENNAAICATFISLAHLLGLRVVAEGVETASQLYFLATVHHCDALQGYLFGKPVPPGQLFPPSAVTAEA